MINIYIMNITGFEIIEKLGEGGMGTVWKANQVSLDRVVALKILNHDLANDPAEIDDFINEARSAAKLKHPNITQIYDVAHQDGNYYIVMEFINGSTLSQILEEDSTIPPKRALKIASQVAEGLEYTWTSANIIHRDIKPDNIMIDEDGTVKITDMGLAKMIDPSKLSSQILEGHIEGTPYYLSPEQAQCSVRLDTTTDMYSLGATLYHMLTGKIPFYEFDEHVAVEMHVSGTIDNPRDINPKVSAALAQLIARMMMKDPRERYASWDELKKEIKKVKSGRILLSKETERKESTIAPPKKPTAKKRIVPSGTSTAPVSQKEDDDVPGALKAALWIVILLCWVTIAYIRVPKRQPIPRTPATPTHRSTRSARRPSAQRPGTQQAKPAPKPTVEVTVADADDEAEIPAEKEIVEAPPAQEAEDMAVLEPLKKELAMLIFSDQARKAGALISNEMEYTHSEQFMKELESMARITDPMNAAQDALEDYFDSKLGQTITLNYKGKPRRILIKGFNNNKVVATAQIKQGNSTIEKSIMLPVENLNVKDCARWIRESGGQTPDSVMFSLYLRAGDRMNATKYAAKCGPFAELFKKLIRAR